MRLLGAELGTAAAIVGRHPFPGPGLGIRIIGAVDAERLAILRAADAIVRAEMTAAGVDEHIWQCPVVLLADVRSVGVQGDGRTYGHPIVLRPVSSEDAMTADWSRLPYDLLARISSRITGEVPRGQPRGAGCDEQAAGHHRVGVTGSTDPADGVPGPATPGAAAPLAAQPVRHPGGVALIIALGALSGFGPLCLDMYLPALPELPADLSSTAAAAQLTLSSCIVGLAVGQLITGPLSDRLGRRGPLLVGVGIFVITSALCAITTSMTMLIVIRFVQGAAGAAGIVIGRAVVADLFAGKVAAAYFSAIATINGIAPIVAPVIGGQVLRVGSWRTVFWVLAGIGVVMLVLAAFVVKETLPPERRSAGGLPSTIKAFGTLRPRSRLCRHGAGRHHGHRRDVRLHLRVTVPAAGRVRVVRAVRSARASR